MTTAAITSLDSTGDVLPDKMQELRSATSRVTGSIFFGTLLQMMRDSNIKGAYGHGGRGEEVFAAQLHGMYAEQLGERMDSGLANQLFRHLAKQQTRMLQRIDPSEATVITTVPNEVKR